MQIFSAAALLAGVSLSVLTNSAAAQSTLPTTTDPQTFYVQAAGAEHNAYAVTAGVTLPWNWSHALGRGALSGHWDIYIGNWSARPEGEGRRNLLAIGAGPSLRWRGDGGRSAWFFEAGTGIVLHSKHYQNAERRFSTRYNFASHIGLGINFGTQRAHELSVRIQHSSNASIKKPNPGEDFLMLRYAHSF